MHEFSWSIKARTTKWSLLNSFTIFHGGNCISLTQICDFSVAMKKNFHQVKEFIIEIKYQLQSYNHRHW